MAAVQSAAPRKQQRGPRAATAAGGARAAAWRAPRFPSRSASARGCVVAARARRRRRRAAFAAVVACSMRAGDSSGRTRGTAGARFARPPGVSRDQPARRCRWLDRCKAYSALHAQPRAREEAARVRLHRDERLAPLEVRIDARRARVAMHRPPAVAARQRLAPRLEARKVLIGVVVVVAAVATVAVVVMVVMAAAARVDPRANVTPVERAADTRGASAWR